MNDLCATTRIPLFGQGADGLALGAAWNGEQLERLIEAAREDGASSSHSSSQKGRSVSELKTINSVSIAWLRVKSGNPGSDDAIFT
jgi:hypothetical protein